MPFQTYSTFFLPFYQALSKNLQKGRIVNPALIFKISAEEEIKNVFFLIY